MKLQVTWMWKCVLWVGAFCLVAGTAHSSGLPMDGLQVQFRSDHEGRVTADTAFPGHGSPINSWKTEDGVASPLTLIHSQYRPNWQTNAFQRADGTYRPAVRFVRNTGNTAVVHDSMTLVSTTNTTLNLGKETTWFLVMNNLAANNERGLFGFVGDPPRFGAFFVGSGDNQLRFHNDCNPGGNGNISVPIGQSNLLDSRGAGTWMVCGVNGEVRNVASSSFTRAFEARASASQFCMGRMVGVGNSASADIAELAVYNRALNDAEVCIVRNSLAARWGLTISNPIWTGAAAGFCDDLAGIGSSTATGDGRIAGSVETSGSAGGLILSVADGSLSGADGYLLAAHNGKPAKISWSEADGCLRFQRTWRTENTLSSVPALTFTFDLSELAPGVSGFEGRLLYRADSSVAFADTGLTGFLNGLRVGGGENAELTEAELRGALNGGTFSFTLPAGTYRDGEYALVVTSVTEAEKVAPSTDGITVWYKPEAGILTNETGAVTNWVNQGSLGVVADAFAYSGSVTVVENALASADQTATYPALDFGGTSFLQTSVETDLGRDSHDPPSWFIVFKPGSDANAQKDAGLFGQITNDCRFGVFFPLSYGGYTARGYVGRAPYPEVKDVSASSWHMLDMTAYWQSTSKVIPYLSLDAAEVAGGTGDTGQPYRKATSYLKVGHFREDAWGKPFPGQIAELRIYKQTLDPIERLFVEQELAAKYDLAFNHRFLNAAHASGATYRSGLSVVGYGYSDFAGASATAPVCGGLTIDYPEWNGADNAGIWVAHNGGSLAWTLDNGVTTLARSWYLCITGNSTEPTFPALRLNFLLGEAEDGSQYALYYRASDTDTWSILPYPASVAYGTASVRLPAGMFTGYFTLGKVPVGETVVQPCAAVRDGLVGWYRADTGVEATGGSVTAWRNLGVMGAIGDVATAAGTPMLSTTAFPRASGASEASVSFDGSAYLITADNLKWAHANNNNTWFVVFKVRSGVTPSNMGVVGNHPSSDTRFGAFFTSPGDLRTHGYVKSQATRFCVIPYANMTMGQPMLLDAARAGNTVDTYLDGVHKDGKQAPGTDNNAASAKFMIGKMVDVGTLQGDIAEVRIYSRALSDVERNIMANHLAARYGVAMQGNLLYGGAADDCVLDVVGIGRTTANSMTPNTSNGGTVTNSWNIHVAGNVTVSDASAGLTFAAVGSLANGDYVLAGHGVKENEWINTASGFKRMKRAWHITKTNAAALDLSLTFTLADAGVELLDARFSPQYRLLRSVNGGAWEAVETDLTQTSTGFRAKLAAGMFEEGQYTLGAEVTPTGTVLSIR